MAVQQVISGSPLKALIEEHIDVARRLQARVPTIRDAAEMLAETVRSGHRTFFCGNGGSAADAQHLAAELTGRFLKERDPWPAIALHVNTSALTAVGNDYGFDQVFARELRAQGREGDLLVALSTSGSSTNVLRAVEAAGGRGIRTIGLTGQRGGELKVAVDLWIGVPSESTPRVQEMHILIGHLICQLAEADLC